MHLTFHLLEAPSLYQDRRRFTVEVRTITVELLKDLDRKLKPLESLRVALIEHMGGCRGDEAPDGAILGDHPGNAHDG